VFRTVGYIELVLSHLPSSLERNVFSTHSNIRNSKTVLKHVSNILLPLAHMFSYLVSDNSFVRHAKRYEPKLNLTKQLLLYITNNISDPVACSGLVGKICRQTYQLGTLYRLPVLSFCSQISQK
jgi:hypothetical protein